MAASFAARSKGEILAKSRCFPVFYRKRTLIDAVGMSAAKSGSKPAYEFFGFFSRLLEKIEPPPWREADFFGV